MTLNEEVNTMIKPRTEDMKFEDKQNLMKETFKRLQVNPENEDFADVIIELAAEIRDYRIKIHELQFELKQTQEKMISKELSESMMKRIHAADAAAGIKASFRHISDPIPSEMEELLETAKMIHAAEKTCGDCMGASFNDCEECSKANKSIEYFADLDEVLELPSSLINICGDVYFTINHFDAEGTVDPEEIKPDLTESELDKQII